MNVPEETLQVTQINAVCTRMTVDGKFSLKIFSKRKSALKDFPLNDVTLAALMAIKANTKAGFIKEAGALVSGNK